MEERIRSSGRLLRAWVVLVAATALAAALSLLVWPAEDASAQTDPACSPAPSGMRGWWPGDGNANDIRGTNHGTLRDGVSFTTGKVGQGFDLDGVDDFVEIPDSPSNSVTEAISLDAWIKPDTVTNNPNLRAIVSRYDTSTDADGGEWILALVSGKLRLSIASRGLNEPYVYADTISPIPSGAYTHVAATFDEATQEMKLYVNGVEAPAQVTTVNGAVTPLVDSTTPIRIGSAMSARRHGDGVGLLTGFFDGIIDEVELFDRALSQQEIRAIYEAGSAGKCKGSGPVARNDVYRVKKGNTLTVPASSGVLANDSDPDGDTLRARLVRGPRKGTLKLKANGSFTYTKPTQGFKGARFVYEVSDGKGGTDIATVTISKAP